MRCVLSSSSGVPLMVKRPRRAARDWLQHVVCGPWARAYALRRVAWIFLIVNAIFDTIRSYRWYQYALCIVDGCTLLEVLVWRSVIVSV